MVGCKMDKLKKEIQSLLERNLDTVPCSGMLPITAADTKIKQTNKTPFNLPQTIIFLLRDAFKRK